LRALRISLDVSQSEFAALMRKAGEDAGVPNSCDKRLVQKWESGEHVMMRPNYRRALRDVTGVPFVALCHPADSTVPLERSVLMTRVDRAMAEAARMMEEIIALRQALAADQPEPTSGHGQ
jgi:hypothetical protein